MALRVTRYDDPAAFLDAAASWLLRSEAEHNLLLGLADRLSHSTAGFDPPIYLATIDDEGVTGCAFRTPPFKVGLTRMPAEAMPLVAEDLGRFYDTVPGVLGPGPEATRFAELWCAGRRLTARPGMRSRIYQLERVVPPTRVPGHMRAATPADRELVLRWAQEFAAQAHVQPATPREHIEQLIAGGSLVLWEDEEPRSMAAEVARTPRGARVGLVHTPEPWRGRGYASACVAALGQRILDSGRRFCFLYADLANPASSAIYLRIGYRAVTDAMEYEFVSGDA